MPEVLTEAQGEKYRLLCPHSMFVDTCLGCWHGHASRLEAQLKKLQHSTALPIRDRIEKAVREQMQNCYQVYKGVPPTVQDWVGGALHYVMWGLDRDLPMIEIDAERSRLEREVIEAAKKWATLRFQPHFGGMIDLEDELQEAIKALIDFESSQQQLKK